MFKIIKSFALIAAVAAVAGVGTYSLYSDTTDATGVTLGSMPFDFNVTFTEDGVSADVATMDSYKLGDVAPGDGDTSTLSVENKSDYNGTLSFAITNLQNNEVDTHDPREDAEGDTSTVTGELCQSVEIRVYGDGVNTDWHKLTTFGSRDLGTVGYDDTRDYTLEYRVPTSVGNEILTDECVFDVAFTLDQQAGFHGE